MLGEVAVRESGERKLRDPSDRGTSLTQREGWLEAS